MLNVATIGHNNPPSEVEIIKQRLEDYKEVKETYVRLSELPVPQEISTDEEAGKVSDHIAALKVLFSTVTDIHKKEKKPYWDAGTAADAWKTSYKERIDAVVDVASSVLLKWNKKKEEEERQRQLEIARKAREEAEKLAAEALAHANEGIQDTATELIEAAVQEEQKAEMIQNSALQVKGKSAGSYSSSSIKREWVGEIESLAAIDLEALRKYFKEDDILSALNRAVKDGARDIRGAKIYQSETLSNRRK